MRLCEHVSKYIFRYNNSIESLIFRIRQYSYILTYRNVSKQAKYSTNCNKKKKKIESINHNKISSLKNYIFTTFDPFFLLFSNVFSSMYTARNQRKEKIKSKYCLNTATRLRYVYSRTSRCVRFSVFVTRNSTVRGPSES